MRPALSLRLCGLLFFCFLRVSSAQTVREQLANPGFKLYCVIFSFTVNADAKLESLYVTKVIDFTSGTTKSVDVHVPQAFVNEARKKVQATAYRTSPEGRKQTEQFTYFGYTPSLPATVITDLDKPLEQQP